MNALSKLVNLSDEVKAARGLLHTPREIAQQPTTWQSTFRRFQQRREEIRDFLQASGLGAEATQRPTVFLVGAGTSDYIGKSLVHLLRRLWQCEVIAVPSTDLVMHLEESLVPQRRYLWISFSRSGDSPEGVAVLERALNIRPDIHHLIVCCNANGRMLRETANQTQVLAVCLDDSVNDRGLAMTSSFSNMLVFGQCMANAETLETYEDVLLQLIAEGESFLGVASDCAAALAANSYGNACFVGSGPLRGVAAESALKLLELTAGKTPTLSESALGLRHGPMAALNEDTLFVCFLSGDELRQKYEADLLEEIGKKHLVRSRVAVGRNCDSPIANFADHLLTPGTDTHVADCYRVPVDVIFGQLLGLFFCLRWNLKPDLPSHNGAISRVVQNVSIYV